MKAQLIKPPGQFVLFLLCASAIQEEMFVEMFADRDDASLKTGPFNSVLHTFKFKENLKTCPGISHLLKLIRKLRFKLQKKWFNKESNRFRGAVKSFSHKHAPTPHTHRHTYNPFISFCLASAVLGNFGNISYNTSLIIWVYHEVLTLLPIPCPV